MRQECINELIQTEKAYIDDMTVVYEVFEVPLRQSKVITKEEIEGIFVNWQEILQCNHNFLKDLIDRWNSGNDVIGDVICSHVSDLFGLLYTRKEPLMYFSYLE